MYPNPPLFSHNNLLTEACLECAVLLQHQSAGGLDAEEGTGILEEETEEHVDEADGQGAGPREVDSTLMDESGDDMVVG